MPNSAIPAKYAVRNARSLCLCLLAATLTSSRLNSQIVQGTIRIAEGGVAAQATVELLNEQGVTVARAQANGGGVFLLRIPSAGRYRVRARQIGHWPNTSDAVEATVSTVTRVDLTLDAYAVRLAPVLALARSRCGVTSDLSEGTLIALENARTQMARAQVTEDHSTSAFAVRTERVLDAAGQVVRDEARSVIVGPLRSLWTPVSASEAQRTGYVQSYGTDSTIYRVPGLEVLASEEFLSSHCSRQATVSSDIAPIARQREVSAPTPSSSRAPAASDSMRILFAPEERGRPDIAGSFIMSPDGQQLLAINFRFVNVPDVPLDDGADANGQIVFLNTANSELAIREWRVDMPVIERRERTSMVGRRLVRSGSTPTVVARRSVRGLLSALIVADPEKSAPDTLWIAPLRLSGVVVDTSTGSSAAHAMVAIGDLGIAHSTGPDGAFTLSPLLPGQYELEVRTPSLDSVHAVSRITVDMSASMDKVTLKIPSAASIAHALCGELPDRTRGLVVGRVAGVDVSSSAGVLVEWRVDATGAKDWITLPLDEAGRVRTCALPADRELVVRAIGDARVAYRGAAAIRRSGASI